MLQISCWLSETSEKPFLVKSAKNHLLPSVFSALISGKDFRVDLRFCVESAFKWSVPVPESCRIEWCFCAQIMWRFKLKGNESLMLIFCFWVISTDITLQILRCLLLRNCIFWAHSCFVVWLSQHKFLNWTVATTAFWKTLPHCRNCYVVYPKPLVTTGVHSRVRAEVFKKTDLVMDREIKHCLWDKAKEKD